MFKYLLVVSWFLFFQSDGRQAERDKMVDEQIEARGIKNEEVLRALRAVHRHQLVPEEYRRVAYQDTPLPIGNEQTISQPYIVALMTELIQPENGMKVLEIGTGSGYQAAVLAEIVDQVYTLEIIPELGQRAEKNLKKLGYVNTHVRIADGYNGWEEHAPFDDIVVTAAVKDDIPPALIRQLKEGGKMVIPIDAGSRFHELVLVEKMGDSIKKKHVLPVRFVPFTRSNENDK
jgi:protein-L-isoaspartate(D-aspartate) O-methyltransferase